MTFKALRARTHPIELQWPFEMDGVSYETLQMRRPFPLDLKRMHESKESDAAKSTRLIADLAEVPPNVVDHIDPEDIGTINDWLEPILNPKAQPETSTE